MPHKIPAKPVKSKPKAKLVKPKAKPIKSKQIKDNGLSFNPSKLHFQTRKYGPGYTREPSRYGPYYNRNKLRIIKGKPQQKKGIKKDK